MDKNKFAAVLPIIVGSLVNKIIKETGLNDDEAFTSLYDTDLYANLENEETKVWTFSVPMLFDLYQEEKATGQVIFPEY